MGDEKLKALEERVLKLEVKVADLELPLGWSVSILSRNVPADQPPLSGPV